MSSGKNPNIRRPTNKLLTSVLGHYNLENDVFEISEGVIRNEVLFNFIRKRDVYGMSLYFDAHPHLKPLIYKIEDDDGNNLLSAAILSRNKAISIMLVDIETSFVSLTNALFICITDQQYEMMVIILDRQAVIKQELEIELKNEAHPPCINRIGTWQGACSGYPPYMTPLMQACEENNFTAIQILVQYGHRLHRPHPLDCSCPKCTSPLEVSLIETQSRYHEYKALASPAYITLSSIDPVIHTFRLYTDLLQESEAEPEYFDELKTLANQCSEYVTNLIGLCRTKDEVRILLSRQAEFKTRYAGIPFNRIQQALELEFRLFVANANCQQVLSDQWYGNDRALRRITSTGMFVLYLWRIVSLPFIAVIYMLVPFGPMADRCRIPVNKFLNEAASFTLFLIISLVAAFVTRNDDSRGPPWHPILYFNVTFVLALWHAKIIHLVTRGNHAFLLNRWNLFDLVMLTFFSLSFICFGIAAYEVRQYPGSEDIPRPFWPAYEPRLVGEIMYSLSIMLMFFRMFSFLQLSRVIGPLQICVFRMIMETVPFLCIMGVVWMAFTVTLYNLYHSYAKMKVIMPDGYEETSAQVYLSLGSSGSSVYWAFFGDADSLAPKVRLPPINLKIGRNVSTVFHQHTLTQATGAILFAMFNLLGIVILMNMLVAIMSDSYSNIVVQAINAWKFARTRVWLSYFYSGSSMPAPYNILPTTKIFVKMFYLFSGDESFGSFEFPFFTRKKLVLMGDDEQLYQKLMAELVTRYLREYHKDYFLRGRKKRRGVDKKR